MHTITLTPPSAVPKATSIVVGSGAIDTLEATVQLKEFDHVTVLVDEGVLHIADRLLRLAPHAQRIVLQRGDDTKSLKTVDDIISAMLARGATRSTLLVSIGGGMATDLGGFIASVFMRGVSSVLIPTTLLGMVDAAIGGKTAVNAGERKNMVGTTTHPRAVIVDLDILQSLPQKQLEEGMTEVVKIAAMCDAIFFEWLEANVQKILSRDEKALHECVVRAIELKVNVVQKDELDRDVRLLLNAGHTIGHAVEALSKYSISHGRAVGIGLASEFKAAGSPLTERVTKLLLALDVPVALPTTFSPDALWKAMLVDKKTKGTTVRIAVPMALGKGEVLPLSHADFLSLFP